MRNYKKVIRNDSALFVKINMLLSVLWIRIRMDPHCFWSAGFGSADSCIGKITRKKRKK